MSSTIQVILSPNIPIQVSLLQNLPFKIRVKEYPTTIVIPPPPDDVFAANLHATSILYVGSNTSTSNVVITETTFKIGNSTVNTFINSSSISVIAANVSGNLTVSGITTLGGNIIFGTSGLSANGSFGTPGQVLHSNGSTTYWGPDDDASAYANGVVYTDNKTAQTYSNAVIYANAQASDAYSNAINYADSKAANAYSNAVFYADTKANSAYSNAVFYADTKANNAYSNATAYADTKAANAYSNAATYADNKAANAYSNAVSYTNDKAANAYSNSVSYTDLKAANAYSNATAYADVKAANAYSNGVSYTDAKAANAYSNAIAFSGNAVQAYTNATTFSSNADNITSGTLNTARLPSTANLSTALNIGANVNANTSTVFVGNSTVNTSISAATITINGVNVNTAITSNAATAYSNATAYADNKAANAYSNATAYADSRAATAFSNAATRADNAYSNGVSYTDAKAANAYSNATAYADARAANAYSNAVAYAASNSYVNSTFLPLAGGTLTGNLTINASANVVSNLAANNVTFRGSVQIDGNLTVSGNTVTISTTNLALEDNMIYLNDGSTTSNPDLGFAGNYNDGTYRHAGFFRDATDGTWKVFDGYTPEPDASAFIDTSNNTFRIADFQANVVMASGFTGNGYNITYINASSISVGTLDTARLPATVNVATAFNLGANVNVNTSVIFVGNSTVNTSISAATITLNGVNVNTAITSNAATAYSNAITYSGNAVQAYTNATTFSSNADNITSGTLNTARLPATANLSTALNVGANVNVNTSTVFVGNSTVNTSISAATITINGVNVNTAITSNAATAYTNAIAIAANADYLSSGTVAFARLPALYLGTTQIQSTSVAQAVTGVTTLAAGNTTITGFANVSSTLQVTGTSILTGNATLSGTLQTISGNANFSSNVLFVDATNGRVGVGISTPGSLLDVAGTLRFASNTTGGNYLEFSRITSNQWKLGSSGVGDVMTIGGNLITFPQDVAITRGGLTISPSLADDLTALNVNHTWNNSSLTFSTIVINVTDTASNANSLIMDLQLGGSSRFRATKTNILVPTVINSSQASIGTLTSTNSGFYSADGFDWGYTRAGAAVWQSGFNYFRVNSDTSIGWTTSVASAADVTLFRDAAGILAQRNSTNTQTFRVYGTFTDSSNYERVELGTTATSGFVGHYAAGTGSNRNFSVNGAQVILQTGTTNRWIVTGSGHFTAATDNSFDIGASGANRPRNIFVAGYGLFGTYAGSDLGAGGISVSNQIVMIGSNTSRSQRAVIFAGSDGARRGAISSEWLTTDLPVEFSNGSVVFAGFSNTGNFGIGNTAPDAKLVVTGTANVSGNVRIGGITTLAANVVLGTSALSSNGTVGTAGDVLLSNGSATYWGQNNIDGGTPFSVF